LHPAHDFADLRLEFGELLGVLSAAVGLVAAFELRLDLRDAIAVGAQLFEQRPKLDEALVRIVDPVVPAPRPNSRITERPPCRQFL